MASDLKLPDASSVDLVLTNPTADERRQIWSQNYPEWGRGLTHQSYLDREAYILDIPMSKNGGLTNWILTTTAAGPRDGPVSEAIPRPILASCETLKRQVMLRGEDGVVRDVWGYGIASVFTFKELRGRGYASRMMAMLHDHLFKLHRESGDSPCSVLYSDIGNKFYAAHGWLPDRSTFLEFPVKQINATATNGVDGSVKPITEEDVPMLAGLDRDLLRRDLSVHKLEDPHRVCLAFVPSADLHRWHFQRDDFYCNYTFSRTPTARGAVYTPPGASQSKVWIFWTRVYNGGVESPEKNVLYINRFVVEDERISDAELSKAILALWGLARKEAVEWQLAKINMWNPSDRVRRLVGDIDGLESIYVVREEDSIASLSWFGEGPTEQVEWVANERYAWC
ncbi:Lysine acetyltransferase [Escovopsis weberi]|uniref:Lysine acetyltransferase n=1 Tax=Escovopsis weberi TaxID=150374 RepID=A0A0M8N097_ESCWE|nr:Lysine acetyltransferase [Escovopsis weberi]